MKKNSLKEKEKYLVGIVAVLAIVILVNQILVFSISGRISQINVVKSSSSDSNGQTQVQTIDVTPKGIPEIYGNELKISYDDVSPSNPTRADQTIYKLAAYDNGISLSGSDLDRYIKIVSQISCEYCCGAQSIIFSNGQAACGCAHSYAMRGLAKYLIKNHPNEFTDNEILEELGKWKTLFFPQQLSAKAGVLKEKDIELNYINLASNKYRDIESGATGGMVGGC